MHWDTVDFDVTNILLVCPADSRNPCRGTADLDIPGGRKLFSGRYRLRPGILGGPEADLSDAANYALLRNNARVTLHTTDAKGRKRVVSRVVDVCCYPLERP